MNSLTTLQVLIRSFFGSWQLETTFENCP